MYLSENFIQAFTDGFRSDNDIGCRIFPQQLNVISSLALPDYCHTSQGKIKAIKNCSRGNSKFI